MKKIFINLKRFDIPRKLGGISFSNEPLDYGKEVVEGLRSNYPANLSEIVVFFPEAHIIPAVKATITKDNISIGCQSVFREDVTINGNFGAFTTNRTATSMKSIGCSYVLVGHTEERKNLAEIQLAAGVEDKVAISRILNSEVKCAVNSGLKVLFCVGETLEEKENQEQIIFEQLTNGLENIDLSHITIAYEPVWAIGPGKTPPDRAYIVKTAQLIKSFVPCDVVYGGGLKLENSEMLASIDEIDGGFIGLTRFTGEIGFYPDECIEIINRYLGKE
jgi:triosephosphate isomerase (TIM)